MHLFCLYYWLTVLPDPTAYQLLTPEQADLFWELLLPIERSLCG
jgi:hypothetical protein